MTKVAKTFRTIQKKNSFVINKLSLIQPAMYLTTHRYLFKAYNCKRLLSERCFVYC